MKIIRLLFLLLFTINILTCCDKDQNDPVEPEETIEISLSDSYKNVFLKRRGHWGTSNNRVSTYSGAEYLRGTALTVNFERNIVDLRLVLKDYENQVILDEMIRSDKKSSYNLPVEFIHNKMYTIEVYHNNEYYFLDFIIEDNKISYVEKMPGTGLYNMAIDNNHMLYFVTSEVDEEAWKKMPPWSSYLPIKVYLSRKNDETGKFEILGEHFGGKLCFDKNNQLWVLSSSTIYKLDDKSFNKTKILDLSGETSRSLDFIAVDNDNNIWAGGMQSGLYKINNELNISHYDISNSKLPTNSMTNVYIDKNNNIWIILGSEGVLKIYNNEWTVYNHLNTNITPQSIWSLASDKNGDLWIGTGMFNETGTSLMHFDGNQWETVKPRNDKNELVNGSVRHLQSDGKKIYVVVEHVRVFSGGAEFISNELLTFDGTKWNKIYEIPENENISDLVVDDYRQAVWVSTLNKGIYKIPY
jgi:Two component regulator propeller.